MSHSGPGTGCATYHRWILQAAATLCTCLVAGGLSLGISVTGAQERGDAAGGRNAWDFDKFFDQIFGEQNAEQKQALERIEIPWQEEEQFGRQAADRFLAELRRQDVRVVSRGKDVEYLRSLLETIRPQLQRADRYRHLTVMIAESPGTDARCFPGGIVVVYRGMLECAQNEAALVGVLGHELSHVDHGHQLRYLKSMKLSQSTFAPGGALANAPDMMNNVMLLTKSFARPFRPDEEAAADRDGATWAYRAGYDPRELAKLFLRFPQSAADRNELVPSFFRSHPYHRERYEAVLQCYQELMKTEPRADLYVGTQNLRERVPRSKRAFEERVR
ncbi:MAG: M48 family metallopeptidase [Pirellulaceae bacterium]